MLSPALNINYPIFLNEETDEDFARWVKLCYNVEQPANSLSKGTYLPKEALLPLGINGHGLSSEKFIVNKPESRC